MKHRVQYAPGRYRMVDVAVPSKSILLTGGIGDFVALDSLMSCEERESLEEVWYACPNREAVETLLRAVPHAYPRLRSHVVLPTERKSLYSKAEVEEQVGTLPVSVQDWSILKIFPNRWLYTGSSFLTRPLTTPPEVARPFVVIVPASSWGAYKGRAFDEDDWAVCLKFLESRNIHGLVLRKENIALPQHPLLLNWQGRTNILETMELVKRADGYVGIDSWVSIFAGLILPACRLAIKAIADFTYTHQMSYYQRRRDFGFLQRKLVAPSWE